MKKRLYLMALMSFCCQVLFSQVKFEIKGRGDSEGKVQNYCMHVRTRTGIPQFTLVGDGLDRMSCVKQIQGAGDYTLHFRINDGEGTQEGWSAVNVDFSLNGQEEGVYLLVNCSVNSTGPLIYCDDARSAGRLKGSVMLVKNYKPSEYVGQNNPDVCYSRGEWDISVISRCVDPEKER